MDQHGDHSFRPNIYCSDLAKLPAALQPLCARNQWVIWRLTWRHGHWPKPPFRCDDPHRFASSSDPMSWSCYEQAVTAVADGDGVTYMLTPEDPFAAIDIDHVRDPITGTIENWAQRFLDRASHSYAEISPSGTGLRIWGTASGETLHRKFSFDGTVLELFRCTRKPLTVTGLQLGNSQTLGNIDALLDRAVVWAQQRQHKLSKGKPEINAGTTAQYSIDQIEQIVREGAPEGTNRSDTFHGIVGHYLGCGWTIEQIITHLEEFPDGIGNRYIAENRLAREVERSATAFGAGAADPSPNETWSNGFHAKEARGEQQPAEDLSEPEETEEETEPELPPMYAHGDPDPRPIKAWAIKELVQAQGHGLLSGQWGTFKSFVALDLAGSLMIGQPFLDRSVKRQSGVLFLAAEGQHEMRVRLEALIREKCGGMSRAPFRWFEDVPVLLQPDGLELLVAMGRQAAASLEREFGLPLGLIIIDTIAASAGYNGIGAENDNAVNQRLMNIMKLAAKEFDCFVLGVDHFGKDINAGTRGGSSKESSGDLVLACLGERELSGRVVNTRLVVRKCRGGRTGQEYYFGVREVQLPELDEDGEPITTLVIQWGEQQSQPMKPMQDSWEEDRKAETRQSMLLLKRVLMAKLAEAGYELPIDPPVRGIDREIVREEFYAQTPVDGSEQQKQERRRKRFNRAIERAHEKQLVGVREIRGITYLWLQLQQPSEDEF
jgi:AAA domain